MCDEMKNGNSKAIDRERIKIMQEEFRKKKLENDIKEGMAVANNVVIELLDKIQLKLSELSSSIKHDIEFLQKAE